MATLSQLTEDFDGGADGASVTTSNSIFNNISGNNDQKFSSLHSVTGSNSMRINSTAAFSNCRADLASAKTLVWYGTYIYLASYPDSNTAMSNWYSGATKIGDFQVMTDGTVRIRDVNTSRWQSPLALALNQWHRISIKMNPGSSTGHRLKVYSGDNLNTMTPSQDSGDLTATNSAATTVDNVRIGVLSAATVDVFFDRIRGDDAVETDAAVSNVPPLINAGADQADVEPYALVTLTATASDPDGPAPVVTWAQISGTSVTLSGTGVTRTFVAPPTVGGDTLVFQATANDGQATTTDDVSVTVLPHNRWLGPSTNRRPAKKQVKIGGVWTY